MQKNTDFVHDDEKNDEHLTTKKQFWNGER
jgi:hypothetical protein